MRPAQEYRDYADECVAWAKQAKTDSERDLFLKMAEDWLRAAAVLTTKPSGWNPLTQ
jgi:hypothetical protein